MPQFQLIDRVAVVLVQEPEAHDNTTTRYLLKKALQRKEEEEAEKEEVDELLAIPPQLRTPAQWAGLYELISASSQARRRKRMKRRKRRLPRTTSRLSRCRKLWRFRSYSSSTLSSSPVVPQRQILMVQIIQHTTEFPQLLYVSGGRCPCCAGRAGHAVSTALVCTWLVFLVTLHLALCSCVSVWPKMLRIMAGTHHAVAGFTGDDAPRAVLLFFVVRPKMLGIMAGMTRGVQKFFSGRLRHMFPYPALWFNSGYIFMSVSRISKTSCLGDDYVEVYDPSFLCSFVFVSHLFGVRL